MTVDLKKVQDEAPEMVSLVKTATVSLAKAGMSAHTARVVAAKDISGSMGGLYRSGSVQEAANRVLAVGLHFDDNGAVDVYSFDSGVNDEGEMTLGNFRDFTDIIARRVGGGTKYAPVMQRIIDDMNLSAAPKKRFGFGKKTAGEQSPVVPVYVAFFTDGAPQDRAQTIELLRQSSHMGVFWQFISIGGARNEFLEQLDDLDGRLLDNASYFAVPDPAKISPEDLYANMMAEYPGWVRQAQAKGLIV